MLKVKKYIKQTGATEKLSSKQRHYISFFLLLCWAVLLFCNFLLLNDYLSTACFLCAATSILICKKRSFLPLTIYFSFFSYLFVLGELNLYIVLAVIVLIKFCLLYEDKIPTLLIVLFVYTLSHLFSSFSFELNVGKLAPFIFMSLIYVSCVSYNKTVKKEIINSYLLGFFVSSILGLFKGFTRINLILDVNYAVLQSMNDIIRFSGLTYDPNFYAMQAFVAIYILLFKKQDNILLALCSIILGLLTFSKSMVLTVIPLLVVWLIRKREIIAKYFFFVLIFALLALICFYKPILKLYTIFFNRFVGAKDLNSFTTGRVDLWIMYIKEIFSDAYTFILGYGIEGYLLQIKASHNTFLEILYMFGLIGFLVDCCYVLFLYSKFKSAKHGSKNVLFIFLFILLLFNLSAYTYVFLWVLVFMVLLLSKNDEKNMSSEKGLRKRFN